MTDCVVSYGGEQALRGVDLTLRPGTVTALTGHNGSGKSTLLHALAGLVPCTSGTIAGLPRTTAFVPQQSAVDALVPLDVRTTVEMGLWPRLGLWRRPSRHDRDDCLRAMTVLGIADLASRRLGDLSGGQRQRTLLAQALVRRADLLLLDEPTTGLDADARDAAEAVTRGEAGRGATVVVATHDPHETAGADTVVELRSGRAVQITARTGAD
ncbi:zinc ABC transporter ATP-binding protein AztA [Rhodococcus sp. HNM0569]|uniref:zinc ABC transporter ATP-binding protein AztA n=1 Tax=Rhodococcus sp. HNM0569 TaxID=2716340 RepID=UPI001F0E90A9|nr:zinc ABC transporter ATP-binding protein AztA [Rhodococcus sp. HNM0569]